MFIKVKIIVVIIWILLLESLYAQTDTLKPRLKLNKTEIDLCTNASKEFIISVDLGENIANSDSLIAFEVLIAYKKKMVSLDFDPLTITTLSEHTDYPVTGKAIPNGGEYDIIRVEGGNISRPMYSNQTTNLLAISGKIIADTPCVADFFIVETFFNTEFKKNYYPKKRSDTIYISTLPKDIPERTINLVSDSSKYMIDTNIVIPLNLTVNNKKYLQSWDTEINLNNNTNIEIESYAFNDDVFDCAVVESSTDKIVFYTIIKDTANFTGNEQPLCNLKLTRKNDKKSQQILTTEISNINKNSCSMNTKGLELNIECDSVTSVAEEDKVVDIIYNNINKTLLINTACLIRELTIYSMLGHEVLIEKNIGNGREINLNDLITGFYIMKLEFSDKKIKAKKLIID